jgi:arabinosaccharide transport system substrate-binding protein
MRFPYGTAALCIGLIALISGIAVAIHNWRADRERPDLIMATFAKDHAEAYRPLIAEFEKKRGVRVQLQVVDQNALKGRLQAALQVGAEVPDVVELLDGTMGYFVKGPLEGVGFVDLTDRVMKSVNGEPPLWDQLVNSRFDKWSSRGRIFAIPHDVHPTVLAYRRDLVEQLGIDVDKLTTWDEFARVGREITKDLNGDGVPDRYMIDLPLGEAWGVKTLMLQRGGLLFNSAGDVTFDSEAAVQSVCWYVRQIEGPNRISFPCGWGQNLAKAMIDGLVLFYICPDWRTRQFQNDIPAMHGKLAIMPMPAWEPGGLRTSTWGATGLAITKQCRNVELAWELAMLLYYEKSELGKRFEETNILPPLKASWTLPAINEPRPFYSNQSIGTIFAQLAPEVPAEPSNAYMIQAEAKFLEAFTNVRLHYAERGERGLEEFARQELKRCADHVRSVIARNVFLSDHRDDGADGESRK